MVRHLSFQWISSVADVGEGSRSLLPPPPLFLDQTEARRAEKIFLETGPLFYLRVWITSSNPPAPPPHLISRCESGTGLSPNLPTLTVLAINSWSYNLGFKSRSESENLKIAIILGET